MGEHEMLTQGPARRARQSSMHARRGLRGTAFRWAVGVLLLAACGTDDGISRDEARGRATSAICGHESTCQDIGPGLTYETLADCQRVASANIDLLWPAESCDGHISSVELDGCLSDIREAPCLTASDFFAGLAKCQSASVCTLTVTSKE